MEKLKSTVTVIGSGGWGTALAISALNSGNDVLLYSVFEHEIEEIRNTGENKLLPGVKIPKEIKLSSSLEDIKDSQYCIIAVPSHVVRSTVQKIKPYINEKCILVNVAKGLEAETLYRMSEIIEQEIPKNPTTVLSGPSHAEEVALGMPTTVVVSSRNMKYANKVQAVLSSDKLRIYTNHDLVGVELGGTVKNVIALAAGICDGMGFGDNTKAALMTRGINEIGRLGVEMGGKSETFAGLTGIGDLIVTCTSMHSRNRRAGILIGQGVEVNEALKQIGTVEGYYATENVWRLAEKTGVEMPITEQCYLVLYCGKSPRQAISDLMNRPNKNEYHYKWI